MIRAPSLRVLNRAYRASLRPAWERFRRAADDPYGAQQRALQRVLASAAGTAFAREHQLEGVRSLSDYQQAVPPRDYDEHAPWIERMLQGEARVLTAEPPHAFERSSGSTSASKYIAYTRGLMAEFGAATSPWLYDLLRHQELRGSSYWSLSTSPALHETTPGGTRIGLADDTEYFPRPIRRLLQFMLPVPSAVSRLPDMEHCRHATLCYLLRDPTLSFVSVWAPSFWTLLLERAARSGDALMRDLEGGVIRAPDGGPPLELPPVKTSRARLREIERALADPGPEAWGRLWPRWKLISCWTDANAAFQLPELQASLPPGVTIQGKGLFATEGAVSFPVVGFEGAVLAINSHLLELDPLDGSAPILASDAEVGRRYAPLLSTAGGLYRYRLGDALEVVGFYRRTPRVRFVGRLDGVSDLAGEKLSPSRVAEALARVAHGHRPRFALVAPRADRRGYRVFVEGPPAVEFAASLETELRRGHHYDLCRKLHQLEALSGVPVEHGTAVYEAALVARGAKAGEIKPPALHTGDFWDEVFGVRGDQAAG